MGVRSREAASPVTSPRQRAASEQLPNRTCTEISPRNNPITSDLTRDRDGEREVGREEPVDLDGRKRSSASLYLRLSHIDAERKAGWKE